jgi:putative Ca2+/H+ antiporter (TMEM165/GDT1 family)
MPAFFLTLIATAVASAGARDQLLVARLAAVLGESRVLLAVCFAASALSAAFAAWLGSLVADWLPPDAKDMLVAIALLLAAFELAWPWRGKEIAEPTRSFFAALVVLLSRQVGDGARFLVFALAAAMPYPLLVGMGGFLGGSAMLALAWSVPARFENRSWLRRLRQGVALVLLVAAIVTGIAARGLLG